MPELKRSARHKPTSDPTTINPANPWLGLCPSPPGPSKPASSLGIGPKDEGILQKVNGFWRKTEFRSQIRVECP